MAPTLGALRPGLLRIRDGSHIRITRSGFEQSSGFPSWASSTHPSKVQVTPASGPTDKMTISKERGKAQRYTRWMVKEIRYVLVKGKG